MSGPWEITLDTHVSEAIWNAVLEQQGNALTGEIDIGDREKFPLEGTSDGEKLEFVMPDRDGAQPINPSGSVNPDSTSITVDEGSFSRSGIDSLTPVKETAEE